MLTEHFKLGVQSFGVTPDPDFLYLSNTHREALASLFYGIQAGRGFTALIAAPGMGKTTLLFHLLGLLMANAKTAFLFQTLTGPEEFLRCLLMDLGVDDEGGNVACMQAKLNSYLLQQSMNGCQVVAVIDEAQNLDDKVLELVRMLSNFENPGKKLIHLILSGQPQLAKRLSSEHLIQLRQRISIIARLAPFNAAETRAYIEYRLRVAGAAPDNPLFSDEAYARIAQHSGGIPRNINNLCFNALSLACALKRPQVDAPMVQETINDLDLATIALPRQPQVPCPSSCSLYAEEGSVFGSRRHRWTIMAGLLLPLALLFALLSISSHDRVEGNNSSAPTPHSTPLANTLVVQGAEHQEDAEPKSEPPSSPSTIRVHRRVPKPRTRRRRSVSASAREGSVSQGSGTLELGSLPLQHSVVESSATPATRDTTQAPQTKPAPVETAQQGEKP